jgi:hypothetical protein
MTDVDRNLSTYAFNIYADDARLYNGIHDLETALAECEKVKATRCSTCNGRGRVVHEDRETTEPCSDCGGSGVAR